MSDVYEIVFNNLHDNDADHDDADADYHDEADHNDKLINDVESEIE